MTGHMLRAAGLAAVYLLVLTSLDPGDVVIAAALGLAVAVALRPRRGVWAGVRLPAAAEVVGRTAVEMAVGSWRAAAYCLGRPSAPGIVEIPRGDRSELDVAVWGVLTGEAPDEIVVEVDDTRGLLLVHVLDASDPDAVRARHARMHARWRGR
jgi:multicomponent Na+:H+ antiporter subunit E